MKLHPTLLAVTALLALFGPTAARADDGALSFELAPPQWVEQPAVTLAAAPAVEVADLPLPIPAQAINPPMRYHSPQQLPAGVYRRGVAVGLNESTSATALLPPAPPPPEVTVEAVVPPPVAPEPQAAPPEEAPLLALDFGLEPSAAVVLAQAKLAEPKVLADPLPGLFVGNSDSLVAWAVGSAEGTRTPNGAINPAYFGHTDPGNRVWNMGTFSYQHGATTPEEADQKQLARLQNQGDVLRQRALKHGLNLTLEETLNGLDLANQSPLAAIGRVGYIERLAEAKANGYEGAEAIVVARTRSYINPNTGRWNAPGLGNTEPSIRRDQQRRANAVAQAIAAYEAQNPELHAQHWVLTPTPEPEPSVAPEIAAAEPVDEALQMWTSPGDPVAQSEPTDTEAIAAAPAPEPTAPEAPDSDPLAALWKVTVERFSQAAFPSGGSTSPQTASLANLLFHRDDAPAPPDANLDSSDSQSPAPSTASGDSLPPAPEAASVANSSEPATEEPSSGATPPAEGAESEPAAIAPPAWAEAKEGSQPTSAPVTTTSPVPGAFPDSTIYMPQALDAEADGAIDAAASETPESPEPDIAVQSEPSLEAPSPDSDASQSSTTSANPANITTDPKQDEPLGFEQIEVDDLSIETSPIELGTVEVETVEAGAIAPLGSELGQPINPDTAREGASAQ